MSTLGVGTRVCTAWTPELAELDLGLRKGVIAAGPYPAGHLFYDPFQAGYCHLLERSWAVALDGEHGDVAIEESLLHPLDDGLGAIGQRAMEGTDHG